MSFGLDYVAGPSVADMKAHIPPVEFVCRYTGYFSGYIMELAHVPQGKVLTPGEAQVNSKVGIALVSNYEWYANRALEGHDAGVWDAGVANRIHLACGGPSDRPIYFSVDIDVAGEQVAGYFHGIASALGLARTGAYGSFRVLHYLFNAGLISYGWQTYAWSYGAWEPRAHIQQYQNGVTMGTHEVDYNQSIKSDFGQWFYGGGENVAIDIHTPGVAAEFDELDAQHWRSKKSGKVIAYGLLESYKSGGLCSLTLLGHPTSNEIPKGPNWVIQFYQFGVRQWKDGVVSSLPLYEPNSLGQDPRIAPLQAQATKDQGDIAALTKQNSDLQAQVNTLETQVQSQPSTPAIPADVQAKLDHDESLLSQFRQLLAS